MSNARGEIFMSGRHGATLSIAPNCAPNFVYNTVMVHIRHLREKLGDDAQNPRFIKNIWGVGYTIEK